MTQQELITLDNNNGITVKISPYGGIITDFIVDGRNIVLGKDNIEDYKNGNAYMGALIGRVANRIKEGKFSIDDVEYTIPINNGPNTNHGGLEGFDSKRWKVDDQSDNSVTLSYESVNGEEGFPGNLKVKAIYTLEGDTLTLKFKAETDKKTPVSLTSHSYFNLNGEGNIKKHKLKVNSNSVTKNNENMIPTGEIIEVEGTPLDFTELKELGPAIEAKEESIINAGGLDHNFTFTDQTEDELTEMAKLTGDNLELVIKSNYPGLQVYTGNFLDEEGRDGSYYDAFSGVAMEPQEFPDSINHPEFPNTVLSPGETYEREISYTVFRKDGEENGTDTKANN